MDWYLDPGDPEAPSRLRAELGSFFARHSVPESNVDTALLAAWELIANAVRHAPGPMWVSLDWDQEEPTLAVHDLGPGFDLERGLEKAPGAEGGFGLKIVASAAQELRVRSKASGGVQVSARLPLRRAAGTVQTYEEDPASRAGVSPVTEGGWVRREPFLMAVAANLVNNVAVEQGPAAALTAVNRVGRQVGAEMEKAYRASRGIEGPLTVEQMVELFIGLKAAIDGDFYLIEADEHRIVLGNNRCPFGEEAVQRAPSLCQMTSAVFGGIAARNRDHARVVLDERIAVGDPGCRVVVELGGLPGTSGGD